MTALSCVQSVVATAWVTAATARKTQQMPMSQRCTVHKWTTAGWRHQRMAACCLEATLTTTQHVAYTRGRTDHQRRHFQMNCQTRRDQAARIRQSVSNSWALSRFQV